MEQNNNIEKHLDRISKNLQFFAWLTIISIVGMTLGVLYVYQMNM